MNKQKYGSTTIINNFLSPSLFALAKNISNDVGILNTKEAYLNMQGKRRDIPNRYYITSSSKISHQNFAKHFLNTHSKNLKLKIEFANDLNGYYLQKHSDHPSKRKVILIYIDGEEDIGTTLHLNNTTLHVKCVPNRAIIFYPDQTQTYAYNNEYHEVIKKEFTKVRRTVIINYVDVNSWSDIDKLYYE